MCSDYITYLLERPQTSFYVDISFYSYIFCKNLERVCFSVFFRLFNIINEGSRGEYPGILMRWII